MCGNLSARPSEPIVVVYFCFVHRAIYFAAYSTTKEKLNNVFDPDSTQVHMLSAGLAGKNPSYIFHLNAFFLTQVCIGSFFVFVFLVVFHTLNDTHSQCSQTRDCIIGVFLTNVCQLLLFLAMTACYNEMFYPSDHLIQMGEFSHGYLARILGYLSIGMTASRAKAQLKTFRIKKLTLKKIYFKLAILVNQTI